jgi:hypothetical protein
VSTQTCPHCGAAAEGAQEYCLQCGSRIVRPRHVVHWLWPALGALLVTAGGTAAAIAAGTTSSSEGTVVALSPLRPAPVQRAKGLAAWPRRDGYTVVIAALPTKLGQERAVARARRALRAGLSDVGLLASSGYASLHPGYLVVFSGIYETPEEAEAALPRAKSAFKSAYVQEVVR